MIKSLAIVKKQIEDINEYEKKIGFDSTINELATTLENFKQLKQSQSNLNQLKNTPANKNAVPTAKKVVEPTDAQLVANFMEWLKSKGFDASKSKVKINRNLTEGTGLVATSDIKEGEDFLQIPMSLFITEGVAFEGLNASEVLYKDRLINQVPNLLLSLFLIKELSNPASEWGPYLKVLPKTYNTVYYWGIEDFNQFKGSPILQDSARYVRGAMRQYCYLFNLFDKNPGIIQTSTFTWELFVWAISTVQSRQNPIMGPKGEPILALIPFWDFVNHTNAVNKITSFYHPELGAMTSAAIKNYKQGDQVFMFYGPRDNTQFLLHQGFSLKTNLNDSYYFPMVLLEGNSEIRHDKIHILEERGIRDGSSVRLSQNPSSDELPMELLPFYRVYSLSNQETKAIAPPQQPADHKHAQGQLKLKPAAFEIFSEANEEKAFSNLLQALNGKLSSYPTTLEQDEQELKKNPADHLRYILYVKINEKKIIDRNIKYIEQLLKKGVMNLKFKQPSFEEEVEDVPQLVEQEHEHSDSCSHENHGEHGHSHAAPTASTSSHGHSHQHGENCNH